MTEIFIVIAYVCLALVVVLCCLQRRLITEHEILQLNVKIRALQRELNTLLREREAKLYFISLIEKELTEQELEIFNKLKRGENE
ncbi:MAG: hypothetical protein LBB59_00980 [Campylobacteraceae bacterium]|jgi:hypothetical protein|nr:hypothetical protein [Campylobacteraceae bacterium]